LQCKAAEEQPLRLAGAERVELQVSQLNDSLDSLDGTELTANDLDEIDRFAVDGHLDLWEASSQAH